MPSHGAAPPVLPALNRGQNQTLGAIPVLQSPHFIIQEPWETLLLARSSQDPSHTPGMDQQLSPGQLFQLGLGIIQAVPLHVFVGGVSQQLMQCQDVPGDLQHKGAEQRSVGGTGDSRGPPWAAPAVAGDTLARDTLT